LQSRPAPLSPGTPLAGRYEIADVLGQGGFGITYRAHDRKRGDDAAIKELAPAGTRRLPDHSIDWTGLESDHARRIRNQFLREASLLRALRVPGILGIRDVFRELGTCFFASDYLDGSETLEVRLRREGPLPLATVRDLLSELLGILEQLHHRGILHRDIKPSNILIGPSGPVLIDFGSAREWHADLTVLHTVQYTPGFAPLEQLSEQARRGPWTDLYALAATAYTLLAGIQPATATDRVTGIELRPIQDLRPDVDSQLSEAIEAGLALQAAERPQSAAAFRKLLSRGSATQVAGNRVDMIDEKLVALAKFRYDRRECPECGGVLDDPKPLTPGLCPCCRDGKIQMRRIDEGVCPICRAGVLRRMDNVGPLAVCPDCGTGRLKQQGLLPSKRRHICQSCGASYVATGEGIAREDGGPATTWEALRSRSCRSEVVHLCDHCSAVFDELEGGRLRLPISIESDYRELFPEEWAMVAAGLDPGAGNAVCPSCGAEYYKDGSTITLLGANRDPYKFSERHQGERMTLETIRFAGVGKLSGHPGWVCQECRLEFDREGDQLYLVSGRHPNLVDHIGEVHTLENWHRIARDLPLKGEEGTLADNLEDALLDAYVQGHLDLDAKHPEMIWRGRSDAGAVVITEGAIELGSMIRKRRWQMNTLRGVGAEDRILKLQFDEETVDLELEPAIYSVPLQSGRCRLQIGSQELALRLRKQIR